MIDQAEGHDPLTVLSVIRRLEIGPVTVEARRLVCPYRVLHFFYDSWT